jgi:predicted nucleotidyltransferase
MTKKYNNLILNALSFFIENPYEEIYLRDYNRRLKISLNSSQRFLNIFLKENLIKDFKRGNLRYFKANIDSISFKQIKILFSVKFIEDSGLLEDLVKLNVNNVVLFGSVAEGKDDLKSDFDFLVISNDKDKVLQIFRKFENKINREVNIHCFNWFEWKKQAIQNKAFYQDIIIKGLNLIGEMPLVN